MVKRMLCVIFALSVGFCCCAPIRALPQEEISPPAVSAVGAVLMEADSETVYFEKNAHSPMGMASTTKIMTALVALELGDPDRICVVPPEAVGVEGSSVYLIAGEKLTLRDLLYALLLSSANDAATAIAICLGGSVEAFCALMNRKAEEMGLQNTLFQNPHGLYHEAHYTTAYDLARIAAEALRNPLFRQIVSTYKITVPHNGVPDTRLLVNHNKMLRTYKGALGVKTGFTKKTGRTLVSAARRDGMTLIAVTLNAPDDWRDHTAMLDYGFASYRSVTFAEAGEFQVSLPVTGGVRDSVRLTNTQPITLILPKGSSRPSVCVETPRRFLFAPVRKGDLCGTVTIQAAGQRVSSPLRIAEDCDAKVKEKRGFFSFLFSKDS